MYVIEIFCWRVKDSMHSRYYSSTVDDLFGISRIRTGRLLRQALMHPNQNNTGKKLKNGNSPS